jgi:hypothetical protein
MRPTLAPSPRLRQMSFLGGTAEPCGFRASLYRLLVPRARSRRWLAVSSRRRSGRGSQKARHPARP